LADNEEWKSDPARPAIIVGTIDMIGSKLLFAGYGDSYKLRSHHAGLVGQDTLIIHDEAHLTPAFSDLLQAITSEQRHCKEARQIAILELSATASDTANREVFSLQPELDEKDDLVRQRLNAKKSLRLHEAELDDLPETIAQFALKHEGKTCKVCIYVRSP
jgi:CRISPR-associated endonuclease/helicase Cas3